MATSRNFFCVGVIEKRPRISFPYSNGHREAIGTSGVGSHIIYLSSFGIDHISLQGQLPPTAWLASRNPVIVPYKLALYLPGDFHRYPPWAYSQLQMVGGIWAKAGNMISYTTYHQVSGTWKLDTLTWELHHAEQVIPHFLNIASLSLSSSVRAELASP